VAAFIRGSAGCTKGPPPASMIGLFGYFYPCAMGEASRKMPRALRHIEPPDPKGFCAIFLLEPGFHK
jgi:hypothetical protein